jgi:superfamily II DNA or RNA helicase
MSFELEDFFPKYPNIEKSQDPLLNVYHDDFNQAIYNKQEFAELKLERAEIKDPGEILYKAQKIVARFISGHTDYDGILLVHEMGSGKSMAMFGSIEGIKKSNTGYRGALILTRNPRILVNLKKELAGKYEEYAPDSYESEKERLRQINKLVSSFYTFKTFDALQKLLSTMKDQEIIDTYSHMVIGIDEVHNLRLYGKKKADATQYNQIHRMLHLVQGCKKIIMSGTPMTDTPVEIAPMLNLILPANKQLPVGNDFSDRYLVTRDGVLYIKDDMKDELKSYMKGRVSFLRSMPSVVKTVYMGETMGTLKYLKVFPSQMSTFQSPVYNQAYAKDTTAGAEVEEEEEQEGGEGGEVGEADGDDLGPASAPGVFSNSRQATLFVYPDGTYGSKAFKKYVIEKDETLSFLKKGAGIKVYRLSPELERQLKGKTIEETLANIERCSAMYASIIRSILATPNKLHFVYGKLVVGSGNILLGCLLDLVGYRRARGSETTPGNRYIVLSKQTAPDEVGRALLKFYSSARNMNGAFCNVLIGSKILAEGITLNNIQEIHVSTPHWNYSELAQAIARGIRLNVHNDLIAAGQTPVVRVYHHVAIPLTGQSLDLKRYELSELKDISIKQVERLVKEAAFDCALAYERNHSVDGVDYTRECEYQTCDYRCDGMESLKLLPYRARDFSTYNLFYSGENVKNIVGVVRRMFGLKFSYTLDEILRACRDYTEFNVFEALSTMVYQNIEIFNRYGFSCYLREDNDIYFIVESLAARNKYFPSNYSKNLIVLDGASYETAFNNICIEGIGSNPGEIKRYMKALPDFLKHAFARDVIFYHPVNPVAEAVSEYFKIKGKSYTIEGDTYSERDGEWVVVESAPEEVEEESDIVIENPYGYSGLYNENFFCIKKHIEGEEDILDPRKKTTGRACPRSWQIEELVDITIELGVPYESSSNKFKNINTMTKEEILKALQHTKAKGKVVQYADKPIEDLRRALYFFSSKKERACDAIRTWLDSHGLLTENEMCGKSGVKKLTVR